MNGIPNTGHRSSYKSSILDDLSGSPLPGTTLWLQRYAKRYKENCTVVPTDIYDIALLEPPRS